MPDRKSIVSSLWLTTSLALLVFEAVALCPLSMSVTVSSRPDCLRRDFALPSGQPTARISATMVTDDVQQVNAFSSEDEEQDRVVALNKLRVPFLIVHSFRKIPDHQLIAPLSILSYYPLRC